MSIRQILIAIACIASLSAAPRAGDGDKPGADPVLFGDLPKVEAVSLHAQTLAEAPADVTVITAEDIRRYGYRTLAEALASVRGFYVTNDHQYHYVGVSGISLPGDFNTRFLVMLNGHPLTDNIYNSNGFFGQDFGLDMSLVERIEIIRGPTSALYGSNGMLANINAVTRSPVDAERLRATVENGSLGERKLGLSSAFYLGRGANLLVAASAFNNTGVSFPLDGLELPPGVSRPVSNADGERGYHTFANLIWHDWSFVAYFNSRDKQVPVGVGSSLSGDSAQRAVDGRSLIGATYKRPAGPGDLEWQIYYDRYRYRDNYDYPTASGIEPLQDRNLGDWVNSELTYELPVERVGALTVGMSASWDLRNQQYNLANGVRQNFISSPDRDAAFFAQQEWSLSARWKLYGGVRLDSSRNFGQFVSPRLAAVYQLSPRAVYKLVYGRPFRNPSAFEQFYNDGGLSYAPAPALRPEAAHSFQASVETRVFRGFTLVVDAFHYRIERVIEAVPLAGSALQYQNSSTEYSTGLEVELGGKLWKELKVSASSAWQEAVGDRPLTWLANSPRQVAKARLGLPVARGRVVLAAAFQYVAARNAWSGDRLGGAVWFDGTATVRLHPRCDLQTGVRNALDRRYEDPIYLTVDRLRGDGRSAFLRLVWRIWE